MNQFNIKEPLYKLGTFPIAKYITTYWSYHCDIGILTETSVGIEFNLGEGYDNYNRFNLTSDYLEIISISIPEELQGTGVFKPFMNLLEVLCKEINRYEIRICDVLNPSFEKGCLKNGYTHLNTTSYIGPCYVKYLTP